MWRDLSIWETRKQDLLREAERERLIRQAKAGAKAHQVSSPSWKILPYRLLALWPKRKREETTRKPVVHVRGQVVVCD